jgi:hypothetical protein
MYEPKVLYVVAAHYVSVVSNGPYNSLSTAVDTAL